MKAQEMSQNLAEESINMTEVQHLIKNLSQEPERVGASQNVVRPVQPKFDLSSSLCVYGLKDAIK